MRLLYAATFVVLLGIEVCIALFVHDSFVRPYIGDVLVVAVVYSAARIVFPDRFPLMSAAVFLFAAAVELVQLTRLSELFPEGGIIATVLGSTFDPKDLLCYAIGCIFCALWDVFFIRTSAVTEIKDFEQRREP